MALIWKRREEEDQFARAQPKDGTVFTEGAPVNPSQTPASEPDQTTAGGGMIGPGAAPFVPMPAAPAPDIAAASAGGTIAEEKPRGFFGRIKSALSTRIEKTKTEFVGKIREVIKAAGKVDDQLIDKIEEILIQADVGAETTMRIVDEMKEFEARGASPADLLESFKKQLHDIVGHETHRISVDGHKPYVILVVGVNGVGKTTTIGKLAAEFRGQGKRTVIVAGDTFRAAAVDQLKIWAERTESHFVSKPTGGDPAGVAYDGIQTAIDGGYDVVLVDTAGRLHTKSNLMEELRKIVRVSDKVMPGAPHSTLLVLDATTGQNAITQAKVFSEVIPMSGIVMTKLDGTAKGGVLIGIRDLFPFPVVKIGVGEGLDDLRDFDPKEFVDALFEE